MQPILQYPSDLRLVVLRGGEVGRLTVLASKTIAYGPLSVTFRIIGESHWITVRRNGQLCLHEILSCSDASYPQATHQHAFDDEQPHLYQERGYQIGVDFVPSEEVSLPRRTSNQLCVEFPNPLEDGPLPFTSIEWEVAPTEINWRTIHYYALPGQSVAVHSTSRLEVDMALTILTHIGRSGANAHFRQ